MPATRYRFVLIPKVAHPWFDKVHARDNLERYHTE